MADWTRRRGKDGDFCLENKTWETDTYVRRIVRAVAVVLGVFLFFRWLLPFFLPCFFGWLAARGLRPVKRFLQRRLRLPEGLAAMTALGIGIAAALILLWVLGAYGGCQLLALLSRLPALTAACGKFLDGVCSCLECRLGLAKGCVMEWLTVQSRQFMERSLSQSVAWAAGCCASGMKRFIGAAASFAFFLLFWGLWLKEGEESEERLQRQLAASSCGQALLELGRRMREIIFLWLGCEGRILLVTCLLCVAGLWLLKNPYALVLGLLIGLLDALPLFGTGTVLIPWGIVSFLGGRGKQGAGLLLLYLLCYFLREIWETRCFSGPMGGSCLESAAAMYVGWKFGGLLGLLFGPLAWILAKEAMLRGKGDRK